MSNAFKQLCQDKKFTLESNKTATLINFVASLPTILANTVTCPNIVIDFVENGMLDAQTKIYPDFDAMLATLHTYQSL